MIEPQRIIWIAAVEHDKKTVETLKSYLIASLRPANIPYAIWVNDENIAPGAEREVILHDMAVVSDIFLPCFSVYAVADDFFLHIVKDMMLERSKKHTAQVFLPIRIQRTGYDAVRQDQDIVGILEKAALPSAINRSLNALSGNALEEAYIHIAMTVKTLLLQKNG